MGQFNTVPLQPMSKGEIADHNARRLRAGMPKAVCGFTTHLTCKKLPAGTAMRPVIAFTEGLSNPAVAAIAELGRMCRTEFGNGRLDATKDGFEWQLLSVESEAPGTK